VKSHRHAKFVLVGLIATTSVAFLLSTVRTTNSRRHAPGAESGVLTGRLLFSPPFGAAYVGIPGTVTASAPSDGGDGRGIGTRLSILAPTDPSGRFEISLPPGRWMIAGRSPRFNGGMAICSEPPFVIRPGEAQHRTVICYGK
jgi:hypothetical protein